MSLEYKPDFERAQHYWDAFWSKQIIDRPCASVWAKKTGDAPEIPRLIDADKADFDSALKICDQYLQSHEFIGEAIPVFRPGFGPDQFAGFLGSSIVASGHDSNTTWSEKIVDNWKAFLPLRINEKGRYWERMHEYHKVVERYLKGRCLLAEIDLHSNIDALEGLRGAQNLLFDMIDEPDVILEAVEQVQGLYEQVHQAFYNYGDKKNLGTAAMSFFYSRGKCHWIQADFICLLNPDMFRKFVLPAIEQEASYLDNCVFHLDGPGALKHLDDILSIKKIDAVQWQPGAGNKPQLQWPEVLHKIQNAGKSIILYGTPEEIKKIHGQYIPERVIYYVPVENPQQGHRFLEWLKNNT